MGFCIILINYSPGCRSLETNSIFHALASTGTGKMVPLPFRRFFLQVLAEGWKGETEEGQAAGQGSGRPGLSCRTLRDGLNI